VFQAFPCLFESMSPSCLWVIGHWTVSDEVFSLPPLGGLGDRFPFRLSPPVRNQLSFSRRAVFFFRSAGLSLPVNVDPISTVAAPVSPPNPLVLFPPDVLLYFPFDASSFLLKVSFFFLYECAAMSFYRDALRGKYCPFSSLSSETIFVFTSFACRFQEGFFLTTGAGHAVPFFPLPVPASSFLAVNSRFPSHFFDLVSCKYNYFPLPRFPCLVEVSTSPVCKVRLSPWLVTFPPSLSRR